MHTLSIYQSTYFTQVFVAGLTCSFIFGVDDGSSNEFFNGYAVYFAKYVSAIYLLLQILILISWAYKVNEYLQEKGNEAAEPDNADQDEDEASHGCNWYFIALGTATLALYITSFTLCGLFFKWFCFIFFFHFRCNAYEILCNVRQCHMHCIDIYGKRLLLIYKIGLFCVYIGTVMWTLRIVLDTEH